MSQAEYELFLSFYDLYYTLLQVALFLMIWNIFYRPERSKRPVIFAGIFAAVNVFLRLCPGIPGGVRYEMKSHMTNIKGLVAGEKYEEVERYIGKLDATIQELDYKYSTGNAVTDVVINDKYRQAVKSGIAFTAAFDYRESDTISAFDMGIVLSNLLNNAIEACEKLERKKRYISLVLKRKNRFLLIEVENSFDGELEWREGESVPATRKQGSLPDVLMEHGVGLRNVKDVAQRYLGDLNIKAGEYSNGSRYGF